MSIFKDYCKYREMFGGCTRGLFIKKTWFSLLISIFIILVLPLIFELSYDHKSIAVALVSLNAIVVAFLVFSMTILITKENDKTIKNTSIKYVNILMNNTEVNATLSFFSIIINVCYLYMTNINVEELYKYIIKWNIYDYSVSLHYEYILDTIGFIALFFTLFVIKFAIDDLLFLARSYRTSNK